MTFQLDYSFDRFGYFKDPARRAALEGACRIWGRLLSDSFSSVPAGATLQRKDPEIADAKGVDFVTTEAIENVLIYVGSTDLPAPAVGRGGPVSLRVNPDKSFGLVSVGVLTIDRRAKFYFDPQPDTRQGTVPPGEIDFVSVALHELAHVLGFGSLPAFRSKVGSAGFDGPKTRALLGGPLPLSDDGSHVRDDVRSAGLVPLMTKAPFDIGRRGVITPVDRVVLEDVGITF